MSDNGKYTEALGCKSNQQMSQGHLLSLGLPLRESPTLDIQEKRARKETQTQHSPEEFYLEPIRGDSVNPSRCATPLESGFREVNPSPSRELLLIICYLMMSTESVRGGEHSILLYLTPAERSRATTPGPCDMKRGPLLSAERWLLLIHEEELANDEVFGVMCKNVYSCADALHSVGKSLRNR